MSNPIINDDLAKAEEAESSSGDAPPPTRVNMLPTPEEARRIRKAKANNYRTYYLLPRYVVEEDGKKRKLEAGEFVENSKLYSIFTPLRDMSDFGIGVGMYFTTTWWLGLLLVICALSSPAQSSGRSSPQSAPTPAALLRPHPRHRAAASTLRNLATAPKSSQGSLSRVPPPTAVAGGLRLRAFGRAAAGFGLRFDGFFFFGRAGGASAGASRGAGAGASLASRLRRRARRSEAIIFF